MTKTTILLLAAITIGACGKTPPMPELIVNGDQISLVARSADLDIAYIVTCNNFTYKLDEFLGSRSLSLHAHVPARVEVRGVTYETTPVEKWYGILTRSTEPHDTAPIELELKKDAPYPKIRVEGVDARLGMKDWDHMRKQLSLRCSKGF